MQKRWTLKPQHDFEKITAFSKQLNINPILAGLLLDRGISTFDEAKLFFRPALEHLHNPFLMKDMQVAVERIEKAISKGENILIYGDYDVDGTTAVALVYSFLKALYDNVGFYLPDRYKEGYGISQAGIDFAKTHHYTLVIALDCGIKAVDKMEYASGLGIDFIICDHHLPGTTLPKTIAVLDPKRADCNYPYKELSGCGVGFKLVQAITQHRGMASGSLEQYLDLVAISVAADIVPITGENRVFAYFGLERLNKHQRPGIKAILDLSNIKRQLTISDIVFTISPRINAAGRIEDARNAVELLISTQHHVAKDAGNTLNQNNNDRKVLDTSITEHALCLIAEDKAFLDKKTTVVFHSQWHKGVVGIVASRLIEKHYRPTIVLTESNGMATGSARSVKDFDIYQALESCGDLLEQFGGHKYAAGLTLKLERLPDFIERFEEVVSQTIEERMLQPEITIDATIDLKDITSSFFKILKQFGPFGPGNMNPVFISNQVLDNGQARLVGNQHLKLCLVQPEKSNVKFDAIAFQMSEKLNLISQKRPFDVCYTIEENEWNGMSSLQLNVKGIAVSQ